MHQKKTGNRIIRPRFSEKLVYQSGVTSAAAAATTTATTGILDVIFSRNTSQFDRGSHVLSNLTLKLFQLPLCLKELASDLIGKQGVSGCLKLFDLRLAELDSCTLFVRELVTALVDALVLEACSIIGEKALNLALMQAEGWVRDDLGAKFLGFRDDGGLFGDC